MEAELTGAKWAAVAPLVVDYGIECPVIDIPLHAGIVETVKNEALTFWVNGVEQLRAGPGLSSAIMN